MSELRSIRRLTFVIAILLSLDFAAAARGASVFNMPSGDTSLQFVTVGDPGNVADSTGYGAVSYTFYMGKYDVTLGQYVQFLNAVAATDTYGCYNSSMAGDLGNYPFGISQSGSPGSYIYSVTGANTQEANMPVYDVTWLDAARFCNWLQNGQLNASEGTATTETGAYTLNGDTSSGTESRNTGATYFVPSENEWYKAAYYKSGGTNAGYWTYPTQSNATPSNSLALAGTLANEANFEASSYSDPTNYLTPVGAFAASPGPYGTYDMGGDLFQWNEAIISGQDRDLRGGAYDTSPLYLLSSLPFNYDFQSDDSALNIGFRVASSVAVPEPGSVALLLAGGGCLFAIGWRRRVARGPGVFTQSYPTKGRQDRPI